MADILDAAGVKIGETRDNQDADAPTRTHPVPVIDPKTGEQKIYEIPEVDNQGNPKTDKDGNVIVAETRPAFDFVPLDYGRAKAQLEKDGLVHVGDGVLLDVDDPSLED